MAVQKTHYRLYAASATFTDHQSVRLHRLICTLRTRILRALFSRPLRLVILVVHDAWIGYFPPLQDIDGAIPFYVSHLLLHVTFLVLGAMQRCAGCAPGTLCPLLRRRYVRWARSLPPSLRQIKDRSLLQDLALQGATSAVEYVCESGERVCAYGLLKDARSLLERDPSILLSSSHDFLTTPLSFC